MLKAPTVKMGVFRSEVVSALLASLAFVLAIDLEKMQMSPNSTLLEYVQRHNEMISGGDSNQQEMDEFFMDRSIEQL